MSDTYERLARLMIDVMGLDEGEVQPRHTFGELDVDSLAMVELVLAAQKEFGVRIGDDDLTRDTTVEQAAAVIDGKAVPS